MSGRPRTYANEQEAIEARRARHRARYAAMTPEQRRAYAEKKNSRKRWTPLAIEPSRSIELPIKPPDVRESVDEYLTRGGCIEVLPSFLSA